jgi:hypothetical protein
MSVPEQPNISQYFSFSNGETGLNAFRFEWDFGMAFILPVITSIDALFIQPYVSRILCRNVLISIRYAAFKRHPE